MASVAPDYVQPVTVAAEDVPIQNVAAEELRAHRRSYLGFERMVAFCALHIALILSCLALAFVGHIPVIAFLLGIGGSLVTISGFVIYASSHDA